jgi:hypothetical protein
MLPLRQPLSALCLFAALVAVMAPARADDDDRRRSRGPERVERQDPRPDPDRMSRQRRQDDLSDSVRRIERSTRGQVLSAERMQSDGRDINRIKVVDDRGRVRIYTDDPHQQQRRGPPRSPPPPTRRDDD